MLTIFSIPKPFRGHIAVIQTNAIRSWTLLRPPCEVMLFGDEKGTAEIATELGVRHFPDVVCNEYGTPLVNSVFEIAQNVGRHRLMCYANADIILMSDFLRAITQVRKHSFLLVGQRWDVEVKEPVDFSDPLWETTLLAYLKENGKLHPKFGIDYFVFPRGLWGDIPPFAIGRPGWDNWMVYRARYRGFAVIDGTKVITAVHQNHDYSHLLGGEEDMRKGTEAQRNLDLLGGRHYSFNVRDATHLLTPDDLKSAMSMKHLYRRLERLPEVHPRLSPIAETIKVFRTIEWTLLLASFKLSSRLKDLKQR